MFTTSATENCTKCEAKVCECTRKIFTLFSSLTDSNASALQIKLNNYLQEQTGAKLVFLVRVLATLEAGVIHVLGDKELEHELRFPINQHALGLPLEKKSFVTLDSMQPELQERLSAIVSFTPSTFLNVPITHPSLDHIPLLVCIVDYPESDDIVSHCVQTVEECFQYTLCLLLNTLAYEEEKRLKIQCQSLLNVARNIFTHLDNITDLLREIMMEARKLTQAERCSLFLLDRDRWELVAKVFDGIPSSTDNNGFGVSSEIRISADKGIVGHVAMTGELLNIRDAYSHPWFYKGVDENTGFKTRNILCIPIKDEKEVIGVAELCNKLNGLHFNSFDEEIAVAFSIYCGISIMHSLMYKKVQDSQIRNKLSNELMMYHMQVSEEDVESLIASPKAHFNKEFLEFSYTPRNISDSKTPSFLMMMFEDLGLVDRWRITRQSLARFILFVKKGYRDPPYHNWMHAFSATHFAYLLLRNLRLLKDGHLTELEGLAFLVACMCHDLDHRGTTNSYQLASNSVLASLYSSEGSVMERHHLSQAMCVLNTEGCNIFESLSKKEYTRCLDLLRDIILATDLAHHLNIVSEQRNMVETGFNNEDDQHKNLLLSLLMTCSDLSDQTKDWTVSKKIAKLVYMEFFSQGDLERAMGRDPLEMMDREKACIASLQLQFLDHIVMPVYTILAGLFPEADCLLQAVQLNRRCWQEAQGIFKERFPEQLLSVDFLSDEELEQEVLTNVKSGK